MVKSFPTYFWQFQFSRPFESIMKPPWHQLWFASLLLVSHSSGSYGGEVYKWTDANGRIHYGDLVPGLAKGNATIIDTRSAHLNDGQRQEAEARLAREKEKAAAAAKQRTKPAESDANSAPSSANTTPTSDKKGRCKEEWKRYEESLACFAPYRNWNGSIKAEASQHCTSVSQPELCE